MIRPVPERVGRHVVGEFLPWPHRDRVLAREAWDASRASLVALVRAQHDSDPRSEGVPREEARERIRNMDLRMQAIETYVTSSNSRLAREIEDLR